MFFQVCVVVRAAQQFRSPPQGCCKAVLAGEHRCLGAFDLTGSGGLPAGSPGFLVG